MLKNIFAFALAVTSVSIARANDSAFARIQVKAIAPGSLKAGQDIKFYGANADAFFNMLPATVISIPSESAKLARKQRFLAIQSQKNVVNISCSKVHVDEKSGLEVKNANGTECRIGLDKPETESDSYDFDPKVCK